MTIALVLLVGAVPDTMAGAGSLEGFVVYGTGWGTNESLFDVGECVGGLGFAGAVMVLRMCVVLGLSLRPVGGVEELAGRLAAIFWGLLLLGPAVFPWYARNGSCQIAYEPIMIQ